MNRCIRQSCQRLLAAATLLVAALLATPGALAQATITYFHNDAAGTPWLATDPSGAVLWKQNYLPYGIPQKADPAATGNRLWFAGRPYDPETGMTYMGARYYMPLLGRFTGMDPTEVIPEQVHSFNRYAYANNNPNKYIDPDGKLAETVWDAFNISLGVQSFVSNVREGNWSGAAVDMAGIAVDGIATALPIVPGGVGASIAAYRAGKTASSETVTLFRSVGPAELADIQATGALRNLRSAEGKYFTTSGASASAYSKQAVKSFGDSPYTVIKADVPQTIIRDLPPSSVDRGIPAWVIPNDRLHGIKPEIMNYSPLPPSRFQK